MRDLGDMALSSGCREFHNGSRYFRISGESSKSCKGCLVSDLEDFDFFDREIERIRGKGFAIMTQLL
jgi:hypothetical protein